MDISSLYKLNTMLKVPENVLDVFWRHHQWFLILPFVIEEELLIASQTYFDWSLLLKQISKQACWPLSSVTRIVSTNLYETLIVEPLVQLIQKGWSLSSSSTRPTCTNDGCDESWNRCFYCDPVQNDLSETWSKMSKAVTTTGYFDLEWRW